ncbi:MAG: TIGR03790 family protein [Gemmataceae bacterium]|nr:TIGR03790 family protein [Gemmataceae bacterium]
MRPVIVFASLLVVTLPARAGLDPSDIFLVVNRTESKSREVAEHYCRLRKVPAANIIEIDVPARDEITRADFDARIATPLRTALTPHRGRLKVILTTFGVPLRVGPMATTEDEMKQLVGVRADMAEKRKKLEIERRTVSLIEEEFKLQNRPLPADDLADHRKEINELQKLIRELEDAERRLTHAESEAAVDSELMQLWWPDYPKARWVLNPFYWQMSPDTRRRFPPTVMTCRIDGPTPEIAMRIVTDAVWAEEHGLKGRIYVDARGIKYDPPGDPSGTGYGGYDESMREMARLLENDGKMQVTVNDDQSLFPPNSCPDCSLYCGWYSLKNFIPSCKFNRGAIAWHLASFEMVSLRNHEGQWCGNLLREGACVTLGPVAEPYTVGFPKPAEFFGAIVTGEATLVECYARSLPLSSWMMCLVGDPLYNPYRNDKRVSPSQLFASPKGSKFFGGS